MLELTGHPQDTARLTVSVIVCAYTWRRWDVLCEGMASLAAQTQPPLETILVVDHNPKMLEQAQRHFPAAIVVANAGEAGISSARNTGVALAQGEVLAFLDDDAVADPNWLEELTRSYLDPDVIGTGGTPRPRWQGGKPPRWLPHEFYWTVGCGYRGLPSQAAPVRNPIGATMSFRREVFEQIDGFQVGLGRVRTTPLGCEETELAIRARRAFPGKAVMHAPGAHVEHVVPRERMSWAYFRSRCWLEGRSKAIMTEDVGAGDGLSAEWSYTLKTLPSGFLKGLWEAIRGDVSGLARAAAIAAGLAITTGGYLTARLTTAR
ncbi:MAG TPA: glycosyltransferase family 2 protein [Solirubrobacterales bacterium]|nr:glycosyltransferase family 2 protein [Solirubrobacterales bacterium]